ncbi:bifunctional UDP-N-acetylglucosamine diphosphorylase/glucosamine-1-phosphate N-acetyltransferase GlmU [Garciella nitratireducens]|uniref:bifunctional UDP-N-acetylglucosamine diphosphorylase/glucosamine-1-phosphate N-acetyltransferase GlmU n=1 Tax=Garciella nitratireducens TaxID=218205 RepID=UPI000DEB1AC7|nr:bifunctional UDP-N-acetylglucosamine diphosphorylase/glucosamine-1-phosphate N-acetyltransferase GlmU [Garciella nitratireducens]RBP40617.1 bifunctional UDP-N-acetylglucosamine pyrophosphorylase/glucosamine-1-phosphate N-acetyltransferase [Garciella nitratireducens]
MEKSKGDIALILAAGAGTRMKSQKPKVLHEICGKPMLQHVIDTAKELKVDQTIVVVGHGAERVREIIGENVNYVYQDQQLGTGHAVMQAESFFENYEGNVLVLYGDTPLISAKTLQELMDYHKENHLDVTVLTTKIKDPTGYGRIIRNHKNEIKAIVEHKDADQEQLKITEINSGMYYFKANLLRHALKQITNDNVQKEYYLTDVIGILSQEGYHIGGYIAKNEVEIQGVNSRIQLAQAEFYMRQRINEYWMSQGVTMLDPKSTYIQKEVIIERDTILYPGVQLEGKTKIGQNCIIGANSRIVNSTIGDNVEIQCSTILDSKVKKYAKIGPYAYIRPNSEIGEDVKIGDFVEVKNSIIGNHTKASHLTYIGDAEVGEYVNLGCGTVFVNYDGKKKHKTIVGDHVFIGCNANLVAPVQIKEGAYIAAGSTITDEVPAEALSIARARQINKEDWVKKKKESKDK